MSTFDHNILSDADHYTAERILEAHAYGLSRPDLTIAPDGVPYLHRWHMIPRRLGPNVGNWYFHIQVADDPERPLHTHPWDNMSVILAGGYEEHLQVKPPHGDVEVFQRRPGDTIFRTAEQAHRLFLPSGTDYTMTLFSTGPKRADWGFWRGDEFIDQATVVEETPEGLSIWKDKR